ncbi:MAG TPA: methyl-accepting chemotaxis protein [Pyrinomonadaceae bacterium]|nr:methyl-accepting chemotaxis protein [Chloracidobacterium sp.]HRJ90287.1 methyl-accepting chemotaxis protein [Pyrinomonadaceae bacterium]HRK49139.1 methyl-accepting chemotaxis protein [Pyrinomonadaceae bacterium]
MENALWNLILKICSVTGGLLLILGAFLLFGTELGLMSDRSGGLMAIAAAVILLSFSIVTMNLALAKASRELAEVREAAHGLAVGQPFDGQADSEAVESLRRTSAYLKDKAELIDRIAAGDIRITNASRSENDMLGRSVARLIESIRSTSRTNEDRAALQRSIARLTAEVTSIAKGDLTTQSDTPQDDTGGLAEAMNAMSRALRLRLRQLKESAARIETAARTVGETNTHLEKGSIENAAAAERVATGIASLAVQVSEVAQNSFLAERLSGEATLAAQSVFSGSKEVLDVVNSIRLQIQETAKRAKRLGERSQEISQIVAHIEDISDRTSVLGLNTALQSGSADRQTGSLSPFSGEIEQLAERASKLSRQLSGLTQSIMLETKELSATMDETIREVISGSKLTDKTGRAAAETERSVAELAVVLRSITESTRYQAKSSEELSALMSGVCELANDLLRTARKAGETGRTLDQQSNELRDVLTGFRLPSETPMPKPPEAEQPKYLL